MKRDKGSAAIGIWELLPFVDQKIIRCPMGWKGGNRRLLPRADACGLAAVSPILWCQYQFLLGVVEVAFRPSIIAPALKQNQLLGRLVGALLGCIEFRPIL